MADKSGYIGNNPGDTSVVVARQVHEPTGIQTTFTFTTGYKVGYIDVYVNGSKLVSNGTDYTATDGNTVGLTTYAISGDIVELVAYKAFNAATIENAPGNLLVGNNLTVTGITTFNNDVYTSADLSLGGSVIGDGSLLTGIAVTDVVHTREITCSGIATFAGSISVGGTITHEDVTNVDSVGIVTGGLGLRATAGGLQVVGVSTLQAITGTTGTFSDVVNVDDTTASTSTSTGALIVDGGVGIAKSLNVAGRVDVGSRVQFTVASPQLEFNNGGPRLWSPSSNTLTIHTGGGFESAANERLRITSTGNVGIGTDDPQELLSVSQGNLFVSNSTAPQIRISKDNTDASDNDRTLFGQATGSSNFVTGSAAGDTVLRGNTTGAVLFGIGTAEKARLTATGGISLNNGELIERCYINATAWSTNGDINLDNGMVQYNTANLAGTNNTLNITSSVGINTQMATGDAISVTCISSQNANTAYVNNITVDHAAVTENWIGGSAPTDGGSSGVDIYAFSIIKTASATYTVIANQNKTS